MDQIVANTIQVKQNNVGLVRSALLAEGGTKLGMARRTGLSVATCTTILNEMAARGEALVSGESASTGGRPAGYYRYNPHYAHVLSLYVDNEGGNNRLTYAVSTSTGEPLDCRSLVVSDIDWQCIEETVARLLAEDPKIKAVGIGIPGIVHEGVIGRADIPALEGVELAERIRARFELAAIVENDMNMTAYGYFLQHVQELDSLAVVIVPKDNGPGTGIVIDGRILRGHSGFAGEVHYLPENYNPLFQSSHNEDELIEALSRMLATIVALVNPQRIVLTGALLREDMLPALSRVCEAAIPTEHQPELVFQQDCSAEYLEGLRLRAQDKLHCQYRPTANQ